MLLINNCKTIKKDLNFNKIEYKKAIFQQMRH